MRLNVGVYAEIYRAPWLKRTIRNPNGRQVSVFSPGAARYLRVTALARHLMLGSEHQKRMVEAFQRQLEKYYKEKA